MKNNYCKELNCKECCKWSLPISYIFEEKILPEVKDKIDIEKYKIIDDMCPFYDHKNNCCSIYNIRPTICKEYECPKLKKYKQELI